MATIITFKFREKDELELRDFSYSLAGLLSGKLNNKKITQIAEAYGPVIDISTVKNDPWTLLTKK